MAVAVILLIVGILIATVGILYTITDGMVIWKGKMYLPTRLELPFRTKLWAIYAIALGFGIIEYDAFKYGPVATQVLVTPFFAIALYVALEATVYYLRFMYVNYSMFFFGKWDKYKHTSDRDAAAKGLLLARRAYNLRLASAYKFGFWLSHIGVLPKSPVEDISDEEASRMIDEVIQPMTIEELKERAETDERYREVLKTFNEFMEKREKKRRKKKK